MSNTGLSTFQTKEDPLWNEIIQNLDVIFKRDHSMSVKCYMASYDLVNKYLMYPRKFPDTISRGTNNLLGGKLYWHLKQFLEKHVTNLVSQGLNCVDEDILKLYARGWNDYYFSTRILEGSYSCLNRGWIKREQMCNKYSKVLKIGDLAMDIWINYAVKKLTNKICKAVLQKIECERNGEIINTSLISSVVNSYVDLDQDYMTLYENNLEKKLIEESESFYIRESTLFLDKISVPEYMVRVEQRLLEEEDRVSKYLHKRTRKPLLIACEKALIENHIELFYETFQELLDHDKNADLKRMYFLVGRIPQYGLKALASIFQQHIKTQGLLAIETCCESVQIDPQLYVSTILQIHEKYTGLISTAFGNNVDFTVALQTAFGSFVNTNAVTNLAKTSDKSPELLAKYCNSLLKNSNKICEGQELDKALDNIIILFKYIADKDVFQNFYFKLLAKRLLQQISISEDAEISMISRLKEDHDNAFITKLKNMMQDVATSKTLSQNFRTFVQNSGEPLDVDFNIRVLSINSWPVLPFVPLSLPLEFERTVNRFSSYYSNQHSGKKLVWLYNLSVGELTTNHLKNKYTISANTLQVAILYQFNQSESWTIGQLMKLTSIKKDIMIQIVQILLRAKLVTCIKAEEKDLKDDSVIAINKGYRNKKLRVNINIPIRTEEKKDEEDTYRHVELQRNIIVQAAIIRIMKSEKTMNHQLLLGEVLQQLRQQFKPEVSVIKKAIDYLIQKEFLEKSTESPSSYNYLA